MSYRPVDQGGLWDERVEDQTYTLKPSSDEIKGELEELAGKMAMITGDVEDDVVTVASVEAVQ